MDLAIEDNASARISYGEDSSGDDALEQFTNVSYQTRSLIAIPLLIWMAGDCTACRVNAHLLVIVEEQAC
jgi:hypothetical protein